MKTFQEMSLQTELNQALVEMKFVRPTAIQKAVIPLAKEGADIIASAETGSGKTAAYGIPLLERLMANSESRALVLAPTRELVRQIASVMRELSQYCEAWQVTTLVGGADIRKQTKALTKEPKIVVATPGRLTDHLKRGSLRLNTANILVVDEADRMLDMGFSPQLDEILKYLPQKRQTLFFTATLPPKVKVLAESYLKQPKSINVGRKAQPASTIKQSVIQVSRKGKEELVLDELIQRKGSVMVFLKTQDRTDSLAHYLTEYGFEVGLLHGGRTQGQRNRALKHFRSGESRILVTTDISSRGIDIPAVEHVINYDLPVIDEDYVHRIGRTGRNGAVGEAVSFVTPEEVKSWQVLTRKFNIKGAHISAPANQKVNRTRQKRS